MDDARGQVNQRAATFNVDQPLNDLQTTGEPSPAAGQLILDVARTQFTSQRSSRLFVDLTLTSQGADPVTFDASDFVLSVGGQSISASPVTEKDSILGSVYLNDSMDERVSWHELQYLESGEIVPGGVAVGWISFKLPKPGARAALGTDYV